MGACHSSGPSGKLAPINDDTNYSEYDTSDGPFWVCRPESKATIRYAQNGPASKADNPARTLMQWLKDAAAKHGDKPALKVERPCPPCPALGKGRPPPALADADWTTWTYKEFMDDVRSAAKAFIKLGLQRHESVNIWGFNTPEWVIAANAAVWAGGKAAGIYPTDTDDTAAYKVAHSGGGIVVVEEASKISKLQNGLKMMNDKGTPAKRVKAFVAYGYEPAKGEQVDVVPVGQVPNMSWNDLIALGSAEPDTEMDKRHADIDPGHCACLIYTSGTTGEPKAVMISHDNIAFESGSFFEYLQKDCGMCTEATQERILSYLPLSHVAGMMIDIVCPLVGTAMSPAWMTVYFARNYDLKAGSIKERLQVARPTLFLGVPVVWEKIADKIRAIGASNTGVKKAVGDWSKGVALANSKSKQLGEGFNEPMGLTVAMTILNKVKENLGLHMCKFCMTGAAPIRVDTLEYFASLGIIINEVYGMSECTGAVTVSTPNYFQWGSCGFELPGVQVRVFRVNHADFTKKDNCPLSKSLEDATEDCQGEFCYRGRDIMMGYMAQPDFGSEHIKEIEKKNSETIDKEGWLHSGDKGMITEGHMCKITGRYKELIIGEGGENIAPVPIEDHVKKMCEGICEVMMVGDKRKYNVALVTLKAVGANGDVPGTDTLDAGAARLNKDVTTISQAMKDKQCIDAVTAAIKAANDHSKVCPNNAFKIQKFTILPTNFSEQGGELTPTKKLKRVVVEKTYLDFIEKMYNADGVYIEFTK